MGKLSHSTNAERSTSAAACRSHSWARSAIAVLDIKAPAARLSLNGVVGGAHAGVTQCCALKFTPLPVTPNGSAGFGGPGCRGGCDGATRCDRDRCWALPLRRSRAAAPTGPAHPASLWLGQHTRIRTWVPRRPGRLRTTAPLWGAFPDHLRDLEHHLLSGCQPGATSTAMTQFVDVAGLRYLGFCARRHFRIPRPLSADTPRSSPQRSGPASHR